MRAPATKTTDLDQSLKSLPNGGLLAFKALVAGLWKQKDRIPERAPCCTVQPAIDRGEQAGRTYHRS
jgi:hypothetical protein